MLFTFIVLLVGAACQASCRSVKQQADGHTSSPDKLLRDLQQNKKSDASEIREGKLLAESMYIALKTSEIRKKNPLPAAYSTEVCFEELGCFSSDGAMDHVRELPQDPHEIDTSFTLYTRTNSEQPTRITYSGLNQTAVSQHFTVARSVFLVMHGLGGSGEDDWVIDLVKKLLKKEDRVVIVVDWSKGARYLYYLSAVANTDLVGRQISVLLQRLMALYPEAVQPQRVHLVGYSLGAHVCGFCGRHFHNKTRQLLGRITALDAAAPFFEGYSIHLSRGDASYVDAIHTSGGNSILHGQFGMETPIGDADFYPNGGKSQPGCSFFNFGCSHRRAVNYFAESLLVQSTQCRFKSHPCDGGVNAFTKGDCEAKNLTGEMGYTSYYVNTKGEQFLSTNSDSPFCIRS